MITLGPKSPKKRARRSYQISPEALLETDNSKDSETSANTTLNESLAPILMPIKVTLTKQQDSEDYFVSSQTLTNDKAHSPEPENTSQKMSSPESTMSDAAFKNLVVKSLGSLESQMRNINQRFIDLEKKTERQDVDINKLKEASSQL